MQLAWPVAHALLAMFATGRTEGRLADGKSAAAAPPLPGRRRPLADAIAVALYALRSERAPETDREPAERGHGEA